MRGTRGGKTREMAKMLRTVCNACTFTRPVYLRMYIRASLRPRDSPCRHVRPGRTQTLHHSSSRVFITGSRYYINAHTPCAVMRHKCRHKRAVSRREETARIDARLSPVKAHLAIRAIDPVSSQSFRAVLSSSLSFVVIRQRDRDVEAYRSVYLKSRRSAACNIATCAGNSRFRILIG